MLKGLKKNNKYQVKKRSVIDVRRVWNVENVESVKTVGLNESKMKVSSKILTVIYNC